MTEGKLLAFDEVRSLTIACWSFVPLKLNDGDKAWKYFEFAASDLSDDRGSRSLVNAVSNSKRALHFRLEVISKAFGITHLRQSKTLSFPQLFDFVSGCGITSPRVLRKLNRVRNEVEHSYIVPDRQQAEDFVDIVELFLYATDRLVTAFPNEMELEGQPVGPPEAHLYGNVASIKIEPGSGTIGLQTRKLGICADMLKVEAEKELAKMKRELEAGRKPTDDWLFRESEPELTAYRRVVCNYSDVANCEVFIREDESYFDWLTVILEKHRSDCM